MLSGSNPPPWPAPNFSIAFWLHKVELVAIGDESTLSSSCTGYTAVEEFTPGDGWKR